MSETVPAGRPSLTPHLVIRDASAAIAFYKEAFGAEEVMRMTGPDGEQVMHAELKVGDSPLYLADEFPDWGSFGPSEGRSPVTIHLHVEDADATWNRAVAAGAEGTMPPSDAFWGDRYGKLVDPFGHHWSISHTIEVVSPEEMERRMAAWAAENAPAEATA